MNGENFVQLLGYLAYPNLSTTNNGTAKFQSKIAVPFTYKDKATGEEKQGKNYLKIGAWGKVAEALGALSPETVIRIQGELRERAYDGNCKSCGVVEKKYWTEVNVSQFEVVE